jgi:hypothetical protein
VAGVQDVHTEMAEAGLEEVILYQARTRVLKPLIFFKEKTSAHIERHYGTFIFF